MTIVNAIKICLCSIKISQAKYRQEQERTNKWKKQARQDKRHLILDNIGDRNLVNKVTKCDLVKW